MKVGCGRMQSKLLARLRSSSGRSKSEDITALSYEELRPKLAGLRGFPLGSWGVQASADELERAANGLVSLRTPEEQIQHLRIFSRRAFPLDPCLFLHLLSSPNADLAYAAAVALSRITHPSVREIAFRLVRDRLVGRERAIAMLDQNWEPNDHELVLNWFERELDRHARHHMQGELEAFWEHHPDPSSEVRMLC
jgi:hypothetical protein